MEGKNLAKSKSGAFSSFWKALPYVFSIVVFIASFALSNAYSKIAKENNQQYFDNIVTQTEKYIQKRYELYENSLRGGLAMFNSSNFVDRAEWIQFVETLEVNKTLPGIMGLGFIELVMADELDSFLEKTRNDKASHFKNYPDTEHSDKFIIKYIEPLKDNDKALGLDIGFETNRCEAAERARDIGKPIITKRIVLVQDEKKEPGFLVLLPFYKGNKIPETLSQRRKNLLGWVYAPFVGTNFFKNITYLDSEKLSFTVYDGRHQDKDAIIYSNENHSYKGHYDKITELEIAGRVWTILWKDNETFAKPAKENIAHLIILLGGILAFLSFGILKLLLWQNAAVSKLIGKRTRQLTQSQEFLSLIMNTIPDLVFVKDKEFKIVKANQSFMELYPPEKRDQVIGHTTVENFSEEEATKFLEQDRIAFENGISQVQEELKLYDGRAVNLLSTKVKFLDEHDDEYILCVSRDITDLIETQKGLEKKVEERTEEYKVQKQIAEQAGQAKEEFLANMSHELRTPLNSILGLTRILVDEGEFSSEQDEMLSIITKASDNLLRTVNDILDISKIESGNIVFEQKTFNLPGLLHSVIDQMRPLSSQKGLELNDNLDQLDNLFITGDEHRITRIITNLISNAIKYTPEGRVDIKFQITDNDRPVTEFHCSVSDTGIGIPPNKIETIFDKFTQAKESTERLYGGTGLGLSITKQLVELMEGTITVESTVGKGSTFTVVLPLMLSDRRNNDDAYSNISADDANMNNVNRIKIDTARILVAEDHEFNQIFIAKTLNRLGNDNFKIVQNGLDALKEIKTNSYDFILMDCNMPKMGGYEATREIRSFEESEEREQFVPIMAMTADIMPGTKEQCLKVGMNDYISKPVDEVALKQLLSRWFIFDGNADAVIDNISGDNDDKLYLDLTLLREYAGDDLNSQKELIGVFYNNSLEDIKTLKNNCVAGENTMWTTAAHRLKGSSSYIGALALNNLCSVAEAMTDPTKQERQDLYKSIRREHKKLCDFLKREDLL